MMYVCVYVRLSTRCFWLLPSLHVVLFFFWKATQHCSLTVAAPPSPPPFHIALWCTSSLNIERVLSFFFFFFFFFFCLLRLRAFFFFLIYTLPTPFSFFSSPTESLCSDKTVSDVQCQHLASDLQRCYIANPGRSLDCSPLVKAFVDCSSAAHTDYLTHVNATPPPNN